MEFASNGKANAGLTLGIIGTSLAGLLGLGAIGVGASGKSIGGFGGGAAAAAVGEANMVAGMAAEIARLNSTAYANEVGIGVYKEMIQQSNVNDAKLGRVTSEIAQGVINLDKKVAKLEGQLPLMFELAKVNSERYTDQKTCHKMDAELRIPAKDICYPPYPQVAMPVPFNTLCGLNTQGNCQAQ